MSVSILYDNPKETLIHRLLSVRGIQSDPSLFLYPTFEKLWKDPSLLEGMDVAIERILTAMSRQENIMIFGDYDVDGVTSSWLVYTFFHTFLQYPHISIRLPNRLSDGYGIKNYHLDEIKSAGVSLVITVDCGITAVAEVAHATSIGLDMIITDHHHAGDTLPEAIAVINPQVSPNYLFKWLCGIGVAFKLVRWLTQQLKPQNKKEIFEYLMPMVAIGTVADCVPLVDENRLFVQRGLQLLNEGKGVPESLLQFIEYVGIKKPVTSYHIGYVIWPRINAGGRILSPYESLNSLLYTGDRQIAHLAKIDELNTERKKTQDEMFKTAEKIVDLTQKILFVASEDFHEGIIGIVAGRLTEKYHRPSVVMSINHDKWLGVASLRGPSYFSVIDMLYEVQHLLERYGGHQQAGGLTITVDRIDTLQTALQEYGTIITDELLVKHINIDTPLYVSDFLDLKEIEKIWLLEPFGQGNPEPVFVVQAAKVLSITKVGKTGNGHLKLSIQHGEVVIDVLFWSKGGSIDTLNYEVGSVVDIIATMRIDPSKAIGCYLCGQEVMVLSS